MSREVDLYKDKIEVSLDGRQIFYLFFGGAVIVGLVFVLGVMVGRRVEARGHVDRANVTTTADPLAALDRLESGNRLSFQDALRGNETHVEATDVEKKIDAMQKMPASAPAGKLDAKKQDVKKDEAKAEDKKAEAKVEDKKAEDKKVEDKKADAKSEKKVDEKKTEAKVEKKDETKTETKTEAKAEKKDEAKADKKDETKTEAKADKKDETRTEAKAEPKKDSEKSPKFTLQLSSFQDQNEAQTFLDSVKASGYQAYVTEGAVDGKQFFRVRMGSYKSLEAANEAKSEFEKSAKKSAIVTKL
jgi:cell division protein FtsN